MKELEMTQEELAKKLGVTRSAVTHYLAGRRMPPLRQFQKLATILKSEPAWLFGSTVQTNQSINKKESKKEKTQSLKLPIPILSWEQVAEYINARNLDRDEIKSWIPHYFTDKTSWYALRIKGDSMTVPLGQKSFHSGNIIIVDPDKEAQHDDFVVATMSRAKEATFKQYVIDGGIQYLKPLNPQYPITRIEKDTHICGVVMGYLAMLL
jgi:SOS-response transcriptional repressor LexA